MPGTSRRPHGPQVLAEQRLQCIRRLGCRDADSYSLGESRRGTESATDEYVKAVRGALQPNIRYPMLPAGIWATRDKDLHVRLESRESALELRYEIQAEPLRLGNGELAVFRARAREYPTTERRSFEWRRRTARSRPLKCAESFGRDAEHDHVLHGGGAQRSSAKFVRE